MEYQSSTAPFEGVVQGVFYGQNERVDEINDRYTSRQFSDYALAPSFDPRPVSTKYSHFPCIEGRRPTHETIVSHGDYNIGQNFNPGTRKSPWSGFSNNVDTETILRNQTFAIQRANQQEYIPSSDSDLYKVTIVAKPSEQTHPLLFNRPSYSTTSMNNGSQPIGKNTFFNHTRTQLRSL
jgi:hypothetical protein